MLSSDKVQTADQLEAVFAAFDESRRERGQFLVQSSRFVGDCYEWRADGVGKNFAKIEEEITRRHHIISESNVKKLCEEGEQIMSRHLSA